MTPPRAPLILQRLAGIATPRLAAHNAPTTSSPIAAHIPVQTIATIKTQGQTFPVFLVRSRQSRRPSLTVRNKRATLRAPLRMPSKSLLHFLEDSRPWIISQISSHLVADAQAAKILSGQEPLFLMGRKFAILPQPGKTIAFDPQSQAIRIGQDFPSMASAGAHFKQFLRKASKKWLTALFWDMAPLAHSPPRALLIHQSEGHWGRCSSRGSIALNWRLIHFTEEEARYLIAHELAHLRHMNHTKAFWRAVEDIFPSWRSTLESFETRSETLPNFDF